MQRLLFSIDKTMCFSSQYISRHKNILSLLQTVHSQQCLYTTIANQNQNTIKKHEDNKYKEMKVKDLKQLVSLRGLDLKGLTRKEQFINVLEEDDRKKFRRESISRRLDNGEQE
jgi:predicted permease